MGARQEGASLLIVPPRSLKSGELDYRPSSPPRPSKGRLALGHNTLLQGHLSPRHHPILLLHLILVSGHSPDAIP